MAKTFAGASIGSKAFKSKEWKARKAARHNENKEYRASLHHEKSQYSDPLKRAVVQAKIDEISKRGMHV